MDYERGADNDADLRLPILPAELTDWRLGFVDSPYPPIMRYLYLGIAVIRTVSEQRLDSSNIANVAHPIPAFQLAGEAQEHVSIEVYLVLDNVLQIRVGVDWVVRSKDPDNVAVELRLVVGDVLKVSLAYLQLRTEDIADFNPLLTHVRVRRSFEASGRDEEVRESVGSRNPKVLRWRLTDRA